VLDPALVVTLGRHSLQTFMPGARIGAAHGTVRPVDPQTGAAHAMTYAMYHPAAALRASSLKQTMFEDMAGIPQALIDSRAKRAPGVVEEPAALEIELAPEPVALAFEPEAEIEVEAALAVVAALPEPVADDNQTTLFG
jgi:DNA polymerase